MCDDKSFVRSAAFVYKGPSGQVKWKSGIMGGPT